MSYLSESRIGRIARRRERLYLAPAGRHVYSTRHTPNTKAPEGQHVDDISRVSTELSTTT